MSHIHIPDGVLPWWLWLAGWLAAFGLLAIASKRAERAETRRAVPLLGALSALVLVSMSSEIIPIAYHVNLTVVAGVLLGPWLGVIASFIVVLVLALLGHGGITVVGLNALVIATEMAVGWALVRGGLRMSRGRGVPMIAGVSTVLTLALTTTMLVGIVALAGSAGTTRETGTLDPETLEFRNPFGGGLISLGLFGGAHEDEHGDEPGSEAEATPEGETGHESEAEHGDEHGSTLAIGRFATVVYTLGPIGWLLEALVTAGILGYVARVRPSLVMRGARDRDRIPRYGDEHGGH